MILPRPAVILAVAILASSLHAQQPNGDPIKLIDQVARHYIAAKSIHLEATTQRTSHTELSTFSNTAILSSYTGPGGRFRYDGRTSQGSELIVSDGTYEWRLKRSFAQYAKAPAGTFFHSPIVSGGDDQSISEARSLLLSISNLVGTIARARFAPSETLQVNGRKVLCTVIQFDYKRNADPDPAEPVLYPNTVWIDPATLIIARLENRTHYRMMQGMLSAPFSPFSDSVFQTSFSVADLDFTPAPDTFAFTPPPGSAEIAAFPNPYASADSSISPSNGETLAFVGKPLPPVVLHDATGAEVPLSRYRGHPLLIDIWETWCGPCMTDLPAFARIRSSTASTDLAIVGIDEDYKTTDAIALLKKRGYDWPDFHMTAVAQRQLSVVGVPLVVLADASGNVVYYHFGGGDIKGLADAIAKLGPTYQSVSSSAAPASGPTEKP